MHCRQANSVLTCLSAKVVFPLHLESLEESQRRHPALPIILSPTHLLSACVPIPATTPETTPATEAKAGFSDLASGLATIDESDDILLYAQLLDEFDACMQIGITSEEIRSELSDDETVAVSIYFAGCLGNVPE